MGSAGPPRERGGAPPGPDKGRDTRSAPPGQNKALISCPARPHSFGIGAGFWDRRRALGSALGSTPQLWDRLWDQPRDLGSAPGSAPAFGIGPRYGPAVSPRGSRGCHCPPPPATQILGWGLGAPGAASRRNSHAPRGAGRGRCVPSLPPLWGHRGAAFVGSRHLGTRGFVPSCHPGGFGAAGIWGHAGIGEGRSGMCPRREVTEPGDNFRGRFWGALGVPKRCSPRCPRRGWHGGAPPVSPRCPQRCPRCPQP